jgi:non-specific serine/threonine protein kinase
VGRDRELARIINVLESARLATLTGPGGTGKTRLALRAASRILDRFPDGVFFVDLAPITDPALVPSAILTTVGPRGGAGPRSELERLQIELRDREILLILDNFEQVIEAGAAVAAILAAAQRIRVLATSRAALRLEGEHEIPVAPLDLPGAAEPASPRDLYRFEAVALFAERATAIDPGFAIDEDNAGLIVEICRRLDGLPLAIELAASRLRVLSPSAMLERLDRAPPAPVRRTTRSARPAANAPRRRRVELPPVAHGRGVAVSAAQRVRRRIHHRRRRIDRGSRRSARYVGGHRGAT